MADVVQLHRDIPQPVRMRLFSMGKLQRCDVIDFIRVSSLLVIKRESRSMPSQMIAKRFDDRAGAAAEPPIYYRRIDARGMAGEIPGNLAFRA